MKEFDRRHRIPCVDCRSIIVRVREWNRRYGYGPTLRELAVEMGFRSHSTIQYHVAALKQRGKISYAEHNGRIVHRSLKAVRPASVPDPREQNS